MDVKPRSRKPVIGRFFQREGILTEQEQELRAREEELFERLRAALERLGDDVAREDLQRFREAREQLAGLFLLVLAGEFNSGKSTVINALLGERLLDEGVTPTTDRISLLSYGKESYERSADGYLLEREFPSDLLRELNIVDTPGTNAIMREHEELTRDFVPRSDLVLFVTSADRPFTESERAFLEQIREWGKKIVLLVNKIDIISEGAEREQVTDFVGENAAALIGHEPELFTASARDALRARLAGDEQLWEESGFQRIVKYLVQTLDEEERVRLKLLNPLNVGLRLAAKYQEVGFERLKRLADDVETLQNIDEQLSAFHEEMVRDFEPRLSRIDALLGEMERRAMAFFDETIRIGRIRTLLNSDAVQRAFERDVIGEMPQRLSDEVDQVIDWIVERNLKMWQDIHAYVDRRRVARHEDEMIGEIDQRFDYNRRSLLDSVGRASAEVVEEYDKEAEGRKIANDVQGTFATTALAEVGAVGIGTLVATVITGAAADITGIALAVVLAAGGFYLIPRKRRTAKHEFQRRLDELRQRLSDALSRQVHREISNSTERINEAIAPYRRFVRGRQKEIEEARAELVATEDALKRLQSQIENS